jgi:hypothetical protein
MTDAELIARLRALGRDFDDWDTAADRIEALEAKLAKAVKALEYYAVEALPWEEADDSLLARSTLAEIKGESHE